jgi:hypothetical protein
MQLVDENQEGRTIVPEGLVDERTIIDPLSLFFHRVESKPHGKVKKQGLPWHTHSHDQGED